MSKPNAKPTPGAASATTAEGAPPQAAQAQASAPTGADSTDPVGAAQATPPALTPPAATPAAPAVDEHHGRGGMYTVIDGQRQLVERTRHESEAQADATADTTPTE